LPADALAATQVKHVFRALVLLQLGRTPTEGPHQPCADSRLLAVGLQVDQWTDYVCTNVVSGGGLEGVLTALNDYLSFRSYMIGHAVSLADVALWGQLQGVFHMQLPCIEYSSCTSKQSLLT
jgi:hypothetical protein